jgi:hypothetical protein
MQPLLAALAVFAAASAAAQGLLLPPVQPQGGGLEPAPINAPSSAPINQPNQPNRPAGAASGPAGSPAPAVSALAPGIYESMEVEGPVIRSFAPDVPRPELCHNACLQNPNCAAYTFARAGAYSAGDPPMCLLKSRVDRAVRNLRVLSGVVK